MFGLEDSVHQSGRPVLFGVVIGIRDELVDKDRLPSRRVKHNAGEFGVLSVEPQSVPPNTKPLHFTRPIRVFQFGQHNISNMHGAGIIVQFVRPANLEWSWSRLGWIGCRLSCHGEVCLV